MKKITSIILSISLISVNSFAEDPHAAKLSKGEVAPFTGVLLSDSYIKEVYRELNDIQKYKLLNASLEKSVELYKANEVIYLQEITEIRDQNNDLAKQVSSVNSNNFWTKVLWFGVGFTLAGLAVHYVDRN